MLSLENALEQILSNVQLLGSESIPLQQAHGRILAHDQRSSTDLPRTDNSAMDGYAVRSADVGSATPSSPVSLLCIDTIPAGTFSTKTVEPGACIRLFTGSPMPAGADAVVMQEDTRRTAEQPNSVLILDAVKPWENVRFKGEDVRKEATICQEGKKLSPGRLGVLAASGISTVSVFKKPVVSILPTGSELIKPGDTPTPASVYESNQLTLAALCTHLGVAPLLPETVRDNLEDTASQLRAAFAQSDAVITCGGASVGDYDFVKQAFESLGGALDFWKVSIRPGKPFIFGKLGSKLLFGLPGNPVSAYVTFFLLVRPALLKMQGAENLAAETFPAILGENIVNKGDRRHFMRVQRRPDGKYILSGGQGSHYISSLAEAEALLDVPPANTLLAGETVSLMKLP